VVKTFAQPSLILKGLAPAKPTKCESWVSELLGRALGGEPETETREIELRPNRQGGGVAAQALTSGAMLGQGVGFVGQPSDWTPSELEKLWENCIPASIRNMR